METFILYLLKSVIWLSGFALVYFLFLRNERFFILKRFYLVAGILISIFFPFISVHYQIVLPAPDVNPADLTSGGNSILTAVQQVSPEKPFDYRYILLYLYLAGVLFFTFRLIGHIIILFKAIKKANINKRGPAKLIRTTEFSSPFSFFNYVFINPLVNETEMEEIMNHELVHVSQKHWFDLLIIEMLRLLQWVNPFVWLYTNFIRLNHEYLADEAALQRTADPSIYKATLLNQMFGSPVISLSDSFNYSLDKKRFDMMKKIVTSPYRKMKVLYVLPVFAIVLYAFAIPDYNYAEPSGNNLTVSQPSAIIAKEVKGIVIKEDGAPFQEVPIVVTGTSIRAITDASGKFVIGNVPDEAFLVFSYRGYLTQVLKAVFVSEMKVKMEKDPEYRAPSETFAVSVGSQSKQLVVVDGVISDKSMRDLGTTMNSNDIAKVTVLTGKNATDKYGEKGKDGVVEVLSTKKAAELGIDIPFRRRNPEDYPTFRGEKFSTFRNWVIGQLNYPPEVAAKGIQGYTHVSYTVEHDGTVSNVKYTGSTDPILGDLVVKAVQASPKWEPAINSKATEPFTSDITIKFALPDKILTEAPFVVVEVMPQFPGGDVALLKAITDNTQYPVAAKEDSIQGRVILRFVVTKEGNAEDVTVLKGVHPLLDAEAARVISLLTGFKPGSQGGKPVDVWYMAPVTFTLK